MFRLHFFLYWVNLQLGEKEEEETRSAKWREAQTAGGVASRTSVHARAAAGARGKPEV